MSAIRPELSLLAYIKDGHDRRLKPNIRFLTLIGKLRLNSRIKPQMYMYVKCIHRVLYTV